MMKRGLLVSISVVCSLLMTAQNLMSISVQQESNPQKVTLHGKTFCIFSNQGYFGLRDALGKVVVSPERGYTFIQLIEADNNYYVITVCKNDYFGVLDLDGNEIIKPNKYSLCVVTKDKILAYENDDCTELNIKVRQKTKYNY